MFKNYPQFTRRITAAAALGAVLLSAPVAQSAVQPAAVRSAPIKGWTAVAGLNGPAVLELARTLPVSAQASGDQPWCDQGPTVRAALKSEFGEQLVSGGPEGTQLWGSDMTGTWTVVLGRADNTQCIIASGIGYEDGTDPQSFYAKVDLV